MAFSLFHGRPWNVITFGFEGSARVVVLTKNKCLELGSSLQVTSQWTMEPLISNIVIFGSVLRSAIVPPTISPGI